MSSQINRINRFVLSADTHKMNSQQGGAMIMALMIMAILSIIGISVINTSVTDLQITSNVQAHNMAMYDADAGVQHTLAMVKPDIRNIKFDGLVKSHFFTTYGRLTY